jgi:hypothetical protein
MTSSSMSSKIFSGEVIKMWTKLLLSAVLFWALVPGSLLTLQTPFTSPAVTHAVVFAVVLMFAKKALNGKLL